MMGQHSTFAVPLLNAQVQHEGIPCPFCKFSAVVMGWQEMQLPGRANHLLSLWRLFMMKKMCAPGSKFFVYS